ncbi:iron-siderophore ABC transporter substrate-binding protein [Nocardioides gansuensis]|uniref:Iron-siderophore ABC transporter substrate-binding protein n=1 Tax=Nocardioides gansuensis TaxID=2138300 RepID=A0A2T8FF23_9ACTN|nr:ABC transporter substrate-binding protein [Nocardioides gansuensis]PVG84321.1 iron-siderophore ABC transporter substrate-binding protein [Nocardioides gansuensis]
MSLRPRVLAGALSAALAAAALAGCSTGSTQASEPTTTSETQVDEGAFPVTIEHVFGETTIEEEPTRVATLGWTDQDLALSLRVVPVGSTKLTWGGNEAGSSDWFDAELEELGAEQPVRYDDTDGAPIDEVAALAPDVILATNSGITEKEYDKLSKIAPVVAYPEAPWVTPWQTSLEMVGQALGRSELAGEVAAETEAEIAEARADFPQLQGASVIFAYLTTADLSTIGIYGAEDNRVRALEDFGMTSPALVDEVVKKGQYYGTLSAERAADVESDVLLTYAEKPGDLATFTKDPLLGQIPALKAGHAYAEQDKHVGLAITNPSPLSIPFIAEEFLPHVAAAAEGK